jgi:hypothetical protein
VVAGGGVGVVAENIDDISTRVPGGADGVPEPDQVAEAVDSGVAGVHETVECFAGLWAPCSPPEPSALSLVKWSP